MALLGEIEMAAEAPHHPAALSAKQRRLIALVDRVVKAFDAELTSSSSSSSSVGDDDDGEDDDASSTPTATPPPLTKTTTPCCSKADLKEFLTKFDGRLPSGPICRRALADAVDACALSRKLWRKILTEETTKENDDDDDDDDDDDNDDNHGASSPSLSSSSFAAGLVSPEEMSVAVFLVLSVLSRVLLNPDAFTRTFSLLRESFDEAAVELREKGNQACLPRGSGSGSSGGSGEGRGVRFLYLPDDSVIGPSIRDHYLQRPAPISVDDGGASGVDEQRVTDADVEQRRLRTAVRYYTAALAACPFDPLLYQNRATAYFRTGKDFDLALTDALRARLLADSKKRAAESADYLAAECLYRLGEIGAAKTLNGQLIARPPYIGVVDEWGRRNVRSQLDRWKDAERKAKNKLEGALRAASTYYLNRRDPLAAIDSYGRVDEIIEEFGSVALDVVDIDFALMAYCRSLAYVDSGIPYYVNCAIEKMEAVIDNEEIQVIFSNEEIQVIS